ncbi:Hypothetical predicted protein [Olea europaea subsp. europaea]|uniref:NAD-dependent epimerase/dehydratase domain-containing protein n=1 Tax=Olea europaea subsp. europaea TaxID=158383 RepID=A0A8S0P8N7_OLEEU|nr:Hypothetical predicted protein [Olea europaea subsp. europaea]
MEKNVKVCITAASGYMGSFLVKELLHKGQTVRATLRNLDIYDPDQFALAIQGCEAVLHMATPLQHNTHTLRNDSRRYGILRFLEELLRKVPISHIQDAIEAHLFCTENPHVNGRFLCASDFLKSAVVASHVQKRYPEIRIPQD